MDQQELTEDHFAFFPPYFLTVYLFTSVCVCCVLRFVLSFIESKQHSFCVLQENTFLRISILIAVLGSQTFQKKTMRNYTNFLVLLVSSRVTCVIFINTIMYKLIATSLLSAYLIICLFQYFLSCLCFPSQHRSVFNKETPSILELIQHNLMVFLEALIVPVLILTILFFFPMFF